jgi:hypothetical protein
MPHVIATTTGPSVASRPLTRGAGHLMSTPHQSDGATHDRCRPQSQFDSDEQALAGAHHHLGRTPASAPNSRCRATCAFGGVMIGHHNRLMAIEEDPDALVELMELAVTLPELDFSHIPIVPPGLWMAFVGSHVWVSPHRVERIFSVATDIVRTAERASRQRLASSYWHVWPDYKADVALDDVDKNSRHAGPDRGANVRRCERYALRGHHTAGWW